MYVFWHQRDLRIPDNRGLTAAAADDEVLPVYVLDTDLLSSAGKRQRAFLLAGVRALKQAYRDHGGDLLVREGSAVDVLSDIVKEYDASKVYYNEHYRPARRNRQQRVDEALPTKSLTDLVLVDPAGLDSQYENHSRFYDDWQAHHKLPPVDRPEADSLVDVSEPTTAPAIDTDIDLPTPGYEGARERFDDFLAGGIETYNDTRDDMQAAVERPTSAVSRMSSYLAAGMIGIREMWRDASDRHAEATGDAQRNIQKYRYELSWREQNYHLLYYNPTLLSENYKAFPNPIEWENDKDNVGAWKRGETGYPFVDAGMRQLEREGYIHNRPRQNVASFLTKHLLVDWREGARHFRRKLVDHDPASNAANWQWTASTGTDSVDVRIFDPVAQMSKYDSGADYVTEYVPELRDVPANKIVDWPTLSDGEREELAPEYPHPIVDRNAAYERAQRVFQTALGKR
ncbi:cryptochrome/photolyase family protein [Haloarcula sp. CGMCC 1.2071]|uniref:cryptochrome/photolyase family protein n=1 Tax=Haloarcula sp. CGMCC 1.2071 TaxID=3111454 RepID=UPI00300F01E8